MILGRRRRGGEESSDPNNSRPTVLDGLVDVAALRQVMGITECGGQFRVAVERIGASMEKTIGKPLITEFLANSPEFFPNLQPTERIVQIDEFLDRLLPQELIAQAEAVTNSERPALRYRMSLIEELKQSDSDQPDPEIVIEKGISEIEAFVLGCFSPEKLAEVNTRLLLEYQRLKQT